MNTFPTVTVVMPVRNEAGFIRQSLDAVLEQDYPASLVEIIVADGMSTDGTREIVGSLQAADARIRLLDNSGRIVPTGLNAAIAASTGEVIIRVDGHCRIAGDYIRKCVEHLMRDGVDGVGGSVRTIGETFVARAIAAAMSSPFGVGGSSFRTAQDRDMLADTIPFPAYTRSVVRLAGPFDEEQVRNQDDEYNYRLRKLGAKILLAHDVTSDYYSRGTLRSLWRQYFQYGYWKVRVLQKHPRQMRAAHFVPPLFVLGLALCMCLSLVVPIVRPLLAIGAVSYGIALLAATAHRVRGEQKALAFILPMAFGAMHIAWGSGFLVGLLRFWNRWKEVELTPSNSSVRTIPDWLTARSASNGL
jgi:succinoglycan biosynthesis protein ExoA